MLIQNEEMNGLHVFTLDSKSALYTFKWNKVGPTNTKHNFGSFIKRKEIETSKHSLYPQLFEYFRQKVFFFFLNLGKTEMVWYF